MGDGGLDKRGYPTGSDAKGKFSIVQVMDNQKEFKIYHTANSANRTPEDAEKHREMYFKMAEEYRIKQALFTKEKKLLITLWHLGMQMMMTTTIIQVVKYMSRVLMLVLEEHCVRLVLIVLV